MRERRMEKEEGAERKEDRGRKGRNIDEENEDERRKKQISKDWRN